VSVQIRLLGRPRAWRDGEDVALRGHKAWLVLAMLLLEELPRRQSRCSQCAV
jgi:DNA-binding SARP family transcriptional activator